MKKSLILRFSLIGAVLVAWAVSLHPLKDRPFLATFERMSAKKVDDYRSAVKDAEAEITAAEAALAAVADQQSEEAKRLAGQVDAARDKLARNARLVADYETVLRDARALMTREEDPVRAEYKALQLAAQGSEEEAGISLYHYAPVTGISQPSNALVISNIRKKTRATLRLGLDLGGGTEFILGFNEKKIPRGEWKATQDKIIEIMRNRVDRLGIVEPEIKPLGDTSISLKMPSVTEDGKADVRETITETAKLTFHLVHPDSDQMVKRMESNPDAFVGDPAYRLAHIRNERRDGSVSIEKVFITRKPSRVRGSDVVKAQAGYVELRGWTVNLTFNKAGDRAFSALTGEHTGKRLAIALDGRVYSAPTIKGRIDGGRAEITGSFSAEEAARLASVIASGNLPVSIDIDSEFGTDPVLGADSIKSGTQAAVWGLIAVLIFMLVYYRFAGFVAILALLANVLLVFGTLALSGATITLPGIAGIVLTIGMAVDANVLIFERIREEIKNGKSIGTAVKAGYSRAFVTILDANLTTLITALILYRVGTGPIRGFAVTLSIGIVASMFTALFMTRAVFDLCVFKGFLKKLTMVSLVSDTKIDFLKYRSAALIISASLIIIGLVGAAIRGGDILSIDFAGGTTATFRVTGGEKPDASAVSQAMASIGYADCQANYKYAGGAAARMLDIVTTQGSSELNFQKMEDTLTAKFTGVTFEHAQTTSIGSVIGEEFRAKAIWAGVLAVVAIVIYVSFRFEFAYGVASVVALVHDVLIAAGVYLLFGRQLSLPVVAALLTIMGYSLNDTIVVFDRIREDLGLLKHKSYKEIINLSINQTLSRTLLTSLTTLIVVVILVLFGGGAVNDFALVMLIGVIVGTYSSIFVASAIIATWHKPTHKEKEALIS
ncbi:MAG: protein translocase subunit SecD [Lentisphaeria bacterium]|nr:protein translocase subunit SecD [Lentisphaeria bacterium]